MDETILAIANFSGYFLASIGFILFFSTIYIKFTPYAELALIKEGSSAASLSLGGAILGFSLPLAKSISQSQSAIDLTVWAFIAMIAQLTIYIFISKLFHKLASKIKQNQKQ